MLQGPDLPLSPPPTGERLGPAPAPGAFAAPAPPPVGGSTQSLASDTQAGEELVPDPRAALTPAQLVERRVLALLKGESLPISCAVAGAYGGLARRRRPRRSAG
jgi:hypothetical protein